MKIVKNNKIVKLGTSTTTVRSTLRLASRMAHKEKWSKIVIVGQGQMYGCTWSKMYEIEARGLLVKAQNTISDEFSKPTLSKDF